MRLALRSLIVLGLLGTCAAASAVVLPTLDSVQAGWTPLVSWWGGGNAEQAVTNLTRLTSAFSAVLHRTDIDGPTRKFIDDSLDQLNDFDLHAFHKLLPEERDGFRELRVRGDLKGNRYLVRRADAAQPYQVSLLGPRRSLADFSQLIRAKRVAHEEEEDSYLISLRFGLGVGRLSWDQTVHAISDFGRIVSNADPRIGAADKPRAAPGSLALVQRLHPKLSKEDVESTALLFDAYPGVSRAFSQVAQLEDMRSEDSGQGYRHVTVRMRASPDRLAERHPAFAKHIQRMGKIAHLNVRWLDAKNRTLMRWVMDSENLIFSTECYVKDGLLLPFAGKTVFADDGVDPLNDTLKNTHAFMLARVQLFGVAITLSNFRANLEYAPHETYATMSAKIVTPPTVQVQGAAAGIIDVLIPGNIQSLTQDFFRRAATGNDNKGMVLSLSAGSETRQGDGVLEGSFELDALDSRLVKMGVGMVNDRLLPNNEVMEDGKRILGELHDAFVADLSRYKGRLGT